MESIEFAKTVRRICSTHVGCAECELNQVHGRCDITSRCADHVAIVSAVEQWEKEHRDEVVLMDVLEIKQYRDKLERRFAAAIARINKRIAAMEDYCEQKTIAYKNYDLARRMIAEYTSAMDKAEIEK